MKSRSSRKHKKKMTQACCLQLLANCWWCPYTTYVSCYIVIEKSVFISNIQWSIWLFSSLFWCSVWTSAGLQCDIYPLTFYNYITCTSVPNEASYDIIRRYSQYWIHLLKLWCFPQYAACSAVWITSVSCYVLAVLLCHLSWYKSSHPESFYKVSDFSSCQSEYS